MYYRVLFRPRPELVDAALDYLVGCGRSLNYLEVGERLHREGVSNVVPNVVWNALESAWNVGFLRKYVPDFNERPKYQWAGAPKVDWLSWEVEPRRLARQVDAVLSVMEELGEGDWFTIKENVAKRIFIEAYTIQRALDDAWRIGWVSKSKEDGVGAYKWLGKERMRKE